MFFLYIITKCMQWETEFSLEVELPETDKKEHRKWELDERWHQFLTATVISNCFLWIEGTTRSDSYRQEKYRYTCLFMLLLMLRDCKSISFLALQKGIICLRLKVYARHMYVS